MLRARLVAALVALAPLSAACSTELPPPIPAAHDDAEPPRRGGTLHLATFGDLRTLDPAAVSDALSFVPVRLLFAGLVDYDDAGEIVGDLASGFEVADGGTTFRFSLREQVRFHDGEELTAEDVRRSFERALHPATPGALAALFERLDGFADYRAKKTDHLRGIVVEGRYVIALHLSEPDATFLRLLALAPMRVVCKSAGARYDPGWAPCGAGPFKLEPSGWEHGQRLTVVRHEGYFRPGLPYLDAVQWQLAVNGVAERIKFERGEIDFNRELNEPDTLRFLRDPRWRPFGAYEPDRTITGEAMNTELPPFDNVEIRRAVAAAIDRDHLALTKASNLRPATHPVPPSIPGSDPSFAGQTHDYAAALEHMRKAGYPYDPKTGAGGWPGTIPYWVYKQGLYTFTGQLVQQDLAKIGLRLELRTVSYPTYLAVTHRRGAALLSPQGWDEDFPDPSDFLEPLFTASAINDEDSNNVAFYQSPRLEALLTRGRRELDPTKRAAIYRDAEQLVCDEAPWAFTTSYRFYEVHQPYVRGYRVHPVWPANVGRSWIDRAAAAIATGRGLFGREALGSILERRP